VDEVINIGGDGKVEPRLDGSVPPSYDITVTNRKGQVRRNIDMTTVKDVVVEEDQFTTGIGHAIKKIAEAQGIDEGATVEATIQIEMPQPGHVASLGNGREKHFAADGKYTIVEKSGTARRTGTTATGEPIHEGEGNLFDDLAKHTTKENTPANNHVDRINIVDTDGKTIVILEKVEKVNKIDPTQIDKSWKVIRPNPYGGK
jgi:hypothetical protein